MVNANKIPIYVFPELKLRGLVPSFYIHVSVSDLYFPTIGPPILLLENMETVLEICVSNFRYSVFAVGLVRTGGWPN
jgi:hypothetical protein